MYAKQITLTGVTVKGNSQCDQRQQLLVCWCSGVLQLLEKEIADFSKDRDKRVKAAQSKLKAAKQVCSCLPFLA